jgi:hypothetical protein
VSVKNASIAHRETAVKEKPVGEMVDRRTLPRHGRMASRTILREAPCLVGRVVGVVVIGLVTIPAGPAGQAVVVVRVTLRTLHGRVEARQCEAGRGVIECRAGPVSR